MISRIFLVIYVVIGVFAGSLGCMPGCYYKLFIVMALLTIPAMMTGTSKIRIIGIIACILALSAAVFDYHSGKKREEHIRQLKIEHEYVKDDKTKPNR